MAVPMCRSLLALVLTGSMLFTQTAAEASKRALQGGTVYVAQTFMAGSLDPRPGSTAWALTSHGIAEKLFTVDKEGEVVGQVAHSVSRVSDLVWEVILKTDYKFSDGTVVTPKHVADCLNELSLPEADGGNPSARASAGKITATVVDSKVRIESEDATPAMASVLAEWVFTVYLADASAVGGYIFTGPYAVAHFEAGDHMDLVPNTYYPQADERPDIELTVYSDGAALAAAFKAGGVDLAFHLPVDELPALRDAGFHVRSFEVGYHYMMWHNTAKAHMSDVKVRKAIDLAIDRKALSQALGAGVGTRSLFPSVTPWYVDGTDPHGDTTAAAALLDEAGWELVDGKRTKNGEVLTIDLVAYPFRPGLGIMQPEVAKPLEALGITVNQIMTDDDVPELSWDTIVGGEKYDLLMWAQNTLPAGDPAYFLGAFFKSDAGNNHANWNSAEFDDLLTALSKAEGHYDRVDAAAAAHSFIHENVPVSNLVTPEWHVAFSDRMNDYGYHPYGSDYYIINAGLFVSEPDTTDSDSPEEQEEELPADSGVGAAVLALCAALFA